MSGAGLKNFTLLPELAVTVRPVLPGDEDALTADEVLSLAGSVLSVRRQAASARLAARALLRENGWPGFSLPRRPGRGPEWPPGLTGSLSHCREFAAASVARATAWSAVGIDIEPTIGLEDDVFDIIALPDEATAVGADKVRRRALWCAKEAAYKALYALDGIFLEPQQLQVDLSGGVARADYGRLVSVAVLIRPDVILAQAAFRRGP